jgi:ankyrin repeat protein
MLESIYAMKQDAVRALLNANPLQASTADTFQRTPLHWACMDAENNTMKTKEGKEASVLLELLEHAPQAVQKVDIERRTPLHYLFARNDEIPLNLLTKMVALYPESLTMKDEVGETPLDILQSRYEEIPNAEDVIHTLLKLKSLLTSSAQVILENHSKVPAGDSC